MNEGDQCKRLSHQFELAKVKSMITGLEDIEEVKSIALQLIDSLDGAKMFISALLDEEALKKKYQ
tara:strand:- start:984 stop:1178 length:195 start_codon:yes stop_codon:yes gene_type:complete